jgi:hypothetical protein
MTANLNELPQRDDGVGSLEKRVARALAAAMEGFRADSSDLDELSAR